MGWLPGGGESERTPGKSLPSRGNLIAPSLNLRRQADNTCLPNQRTIGTRTASAKGRLIHAHRKNSGRTPEQIEDLRRDLNEAKIADYLERVLAQAPPMTDEQRTRLAELLRPVRVNGGDQ